MKDYSKEAPAKKEEAHPYAVVTVAMGEGLLNLLKSLGASA